MENTQKEEKGIVLNDSDFIEAKRDYLANELEKAMPLLQIPFIGYSLYKLGKLMKYL